MNKKQIIGLVIAVVLFIVTGVSSVLSNRAADSMALNSMEQILSGGYSINAPREDYVAVVNVEGVIQGQTEAGIFEEVVGYQHTSTLEFLDYLMSDSNNVGVLLYVDSPGGTIYESEELYQKLMEYKENTGRPIWDYMAHYAASGGYYVSAAADRIYANPNTVTGSIGVIMSGYDMSGLYEKLGIKYFSITSGENKDSSQMTEEQIAIYQSQVDEAYEQFINVVATGRDMEPEAVKALADGRTYTAKQGLENGLVDEIALYEDMQNAVAKEAGTSVFYEMETPKSTLSSLFGAIKNVIPKSESQVLSEIAESKKTGGLQYYAEQLQ